MSPGQIVPLQCLGMGHNGHGINLNGVLMILMGNLHVGGHHDRGSLSPSTPDVWSVCVKECSVLVRDIERYHTFEEEIEKKV